MNEERWQRALSDEVRAELARLDRTAKDAYTSLRISSTAWQTYFKRRTRDVPSHVLLAVADYLGMPLSVLVARTEARERELADLESSHQASAADLTERAISQTSPEAQDALRKIRADMGHGDGAAGLGEAANH